ncbi:MAG: lactate utilization protein [Prevotella sp.]|nr:lactate utilization protein [Prevotella sp.]
MSATDIRNERLGRKVVSNLEKRNFEAYYLPTAEEARQKVLDLIPEGSTVTWGGSMTIRDMGLTSALHAGNYVVIDRDLTTTVDEQVDCYRRAFSCDYYLSSANAMSEDGVIVNIDGNGNRVAAITWGPKRVIFVVGVNKIAQDVESALKRARSTAAPINASRFNVETPCQKDGLCHNCKSTDCICNYIHFLRNSHPAKRHIVVIVGEPLGY